MDVIREYYDENPRGAIMFLLLCIAIIAIGCVAEYSMYYSEPHWETITVKDKNIDAKDMERWLIYTDNEVYSVTDLVFAGYFNASDVYNTLHIGKTYKVYVSGSRIPFLSSYKVIRTGVEL